MSDSERDETHDERAWDRGWEEHARAQRLRMANLPLWVKLQWLEDAQRMLQHMGREKRSTEDSEPDSS